MPYRSMHDMDKRKCGYSLKNHPLHPGTLMFIAYRMYVEPCNFAGTRCFSKAGVPAPVRVNSKRHFSRSLDAHESCGIFRRERSPCPVSALVPRVGQLKRNEHGLGQGSSRTYWTQCSSCPGNIGFATIPCSHMFVAMKQSSH